MSVQDFPCPQVLTPALLQGLTKLLVTLPDPRNRRRPKHLLTDIVAIALCAVVANCDAWQDITIYAREKEEWLRTFLKLPHGIPSRDTFRRVFERLQPRAFQEVFLQWIATLGPAGADVTEDTPSQRHVAIDGKTLRSSFDRAAAQSPLHLVQAWCSRSSFVLAQVPTDSKSNEITAIPQLLDLLDLRATTITIDAAGCQKAIAQKIVAGGGDYLLALKDNHPKLAQATAEFFEQLHAAALPKTVRTCETNECRARGRREERQYTIAPIPADLPGKEQWSGLKTLVQATTTIAYQDRTTTEVRYYLSNLPVDRLDQAARCVRRHWSIESTLHWTLDMTFHEDRSRIADRNAAENFGWLRRTALSLVKRHQTALKKAGQKYPPSLRALRKATGWTNSLLATVLLGTT